MERKYRLTDNTIKIGDRRLYQIECLRELGSRAKPGDLGGFIANESNLSHEGNCWVADNAWVWGHARIHDNAIVCDGAHVCGRAQIFDKAVVCGQACVIGNAIVKGVSMISNFVTVGDSAEIDDAYVWGNAQIFGNAYICQNDSYCCFNNFGRAGRSTTAYLTKDGTVEVRCGCFHGSVDKFIKQVKETHGDSKYAREYLAIAEVIKARFDLKQ